MKHRIRAALMLWLLLAGCATQEGAGNTTVNDAASATAAADVVLPPGYEMLERDDFALIVPESWLVLSPDVTENLADAVESLTDLDPLPEAYQEQAAELYATGARLIAYDSESDVLPTTLNLLVAPTEATVKTMLRLTLEELAAMGGVELTSSTIDLPTGPAYEVVYALPELDFEGWLIHTIVDGQQWMLSAGGPSLDDIDIDLRVIASSLRVKN